MAATTDITGGLDCDESPKGKAAGESLQKLIHKAFASAGPSGQRAKNFLNKVMEVMWAAGAKEVVQEARYAHLEGAARMGNDPRTSVVDGYGRSHDISNLFVCDGSVLPTQGSANPGLTIQALAARTADYMISQGDRIFTSSQRNMERPPVRRNLSPPGTSGKGVPRLR